MAVVRRHLSPALAVFSVGPGLPYAVALALFFAVRPGEGAGPWRKCLCFTSFYHRSFGARS